MAGRAIGKGNLLVPGVWLRTLRLRMTFDAGGFLVRPFQREGRPRVVESGRLFPAGSVVAAFAFRPKLPAMLVRMAARAFAAQAEISPARVLHG